VSKLPRLDGKAVDVLGLGVTTVDDLLYVRTFPVADTKVRILRREQQCGGLTATALVAAARLGSRCMYAGMLGPDPLSAFVHTRLGEEDIDLSQVIFDAAAHPLHATVIVETERPTRTILYGVEAVTGASAQGPAEEVIRSCRVLFVDPYGLPGMIRAAAIARAAGIPVVGDFENPAPPEEPALLQLVDHLIISDAFASELSGERDAAQAARALFGPQHAVVAVTCGDAGAWYVSGDRPGVAEHVPAYRVQVVDTTGCGDVFHGAYAAALAEGMATAARMRFASAAAALKATRPGGQQGIPRRAEVEAFMRHGA
jgi:sulfofructose kinase